MLKPHLISFRTVKSYIYGQHVKCFKAVYTSMYLSSQNRSILVKCLRVEMAIMQSILSIPPVLIAEGLTNYWCPWRSGNLGLCTVHLLFAFRTMIPPVQLFCADTMLQDFLGARSSWLNYLIMHRLLSNNTVPGVLGVPGTQGDQVYMLLCRLIYRAVVQWAWLTAHTMLSMSLRYSLIDDWSGPFW